MSRIRITGGEWRSRLIKVIDAPGLRPTPDRVRETLFNWLGQDLSGLRCLDLFAGSGILGFEAASRGADNVTLVESSRPTYLTLKQQAGIFACPRVEVHCRDALEFSRSVVQGFDLVFIDPPYGQGWLKRLEPNIDKLAAPEARLYVEAEAPLEQLDALRNWSVLKQGKAGLVYFNLLERA